MSARFYSLVEVSKMMKMCCSEKMGSCKRVCRALLNEGEAAALTSYQDPPRNLLSN